MPSLNTKLASAPNTTANYVLKATTSTTIGNSLIFDNGTNVGIGNTNTSFTFDVTGTGRFTGATYLAISSGSVGVGTTSPYAPFGGNAKAMEIRSGDTTSIPSLFLRNSDATASLGFYINPSGTGTVGTSSNHALQLVTNDVERLRITSTGNVGIGTSSPDRLLQISRTSGQAVFSIIAADNDSADIFLGDSNNNAEAVIRFINGTNSLGFLNGGSERMRITSDGNALIGTTNGNPAVNNVTGIALKAGGLAEFSNASDAVVRMNRKTDNGVILGFYKDGGLVGSISTNSNSLPSDRNFKKDISEISLGLNLITKLNPVHYRYNFDDDNEALSNGIIAQELEQSLLECGIEKNSLLMLQHKPNEKEGESQYWVDYTKMIPVLIKAIQEQQAQIEAQQQTINSLINR
jgi:hypothetical protein